MQPRFTIRGAGALALWAVVVLAAAPVRAQEAAGAESKESAEAAQQQFIRTVMSIDWKVGPTSVTIGEQAEMKVPDGHRFTAGPGTRKLLEAMHNPTDGQELGLLTTNDMKWFLLFDFADIGYIENADEEELDSDEILDSIKKGTEASNEERRKRGWNTIRIVGWKKAPFYNKETKNLEWCIEGETQGHKIVNYKTRILGREGVMGANLMVDPNELDTVLPKIKEILGGFSFKGGKKYSEFKKGDKIAKYGLAALVLGGGAAAAAKLGLFAKLFSMLGKAWKVVVVGIIALLAGLKSLIFGRKKGQEQAPVQPTEAPVDVGAEDTGEENDQQDRRV